MEYIIHLAILSSIFAILSIGLNLVVGYTGLLSVTHAAFYGTGAYTTAILITKYQFNFFTALVLGVIVTAVLALALGLITSKFKGDYYALATVGFNVIAFTVFVNWDSLTRGALGIPGISRPEIFGFSFFEPLAYLTLVLVGVALVYSIAQFLVNSSFGRVLRAIREDEQAIAAFGYNTWYFKVVIFVISASLAAVAGSLYAGYITYISPINFALHESVIILAMIILGGLANLHGSIIGAAFLILLPEFLRFVGFPAEVAAQMRLLIYGLLLVLLMMYRPQGLMGEYKL